MDIANIEKDVLSDNEKFIKVAVKCLTDNWEMLIKSCLAQKPETVRTYKWLVIPKHKYERYETTIGRSNKNLIDTTIMIVKLYDDEKLRKRVQDELNKEKGDDIYSFELDEGWGKSTGFFSHEKAIKFKLYKKIK